MPSSSSAAFPRDPFVMDGLTVRGAQAYSAAPRRLTIWGGTIQSISVPVHSGPTSGNSSADVTVRFRSTGSAVLLAWGGHLAQSAYWNRSTGGASDGAAMVSGSPWHMRSLQLDGAGNKNQDRSIQPSAIVGELPPFALAPPTPTPRPTAPSAPRPTPRPTAAPFGPQPPGAPGNPPANAGDPPGIPTVTIPPTATASWIGRHSPAQGALLMIAVGTTMLALLFLVPVLRRRRPR